MRLRLWALTGGLALALVATGTVYIATRDDAAPPTTPRAERRLDPRPTNGSSPTTGGSPTPSKAPSATASPTAKSTRTSKPRPRDEPPQPEPKPPLSGTHCAASVLPKHGTWDAAVSAADQRYDGLDAVRVFDTVPSPWPGPAGRIGRTVIVSFKMTPQDVLSGAYDAKIRSWFATAPTNRDIYWSLHHEPEDNVEAGEFTTEQYRAAWKHLDDLAASADNPRLYATLILMDWTLDPLSGRNWKDYYVADAIDVLGFDVYNHGRKDDPQTYWNADQLLERVVRTARETGKPFGIAEMGSPRIAGDESGQGRARWIRSMTEYLERHDALWVAYFDIDHAPDQDYRLRDTPSVAAWRDFCGS